MVDFWTRQPEQAWMKEHTDATVAFEDGETEALSLQRVG